MNPMSQDVALPPELVEAAAAFLSSGTWVFLCAGAFLTALAGLGILYMITIIAPGITERCAASLRERNILSFAAGLPLTVLLMGVIGVTARVPILAGIGTVAAGTLVLLGWASAAEDLGRRLFWISGREGTRASHLASGWLVFLFGSSFPLLGWFLIFPYVTLSGLGSVALGLLRSPASDKASSAPAAWK